jgi:hypothetical protein
METYQKTLPPKKPASSFMLFSGEVRQSVLKQNPKLSATDVAKALGQQWKQLTPQKKKVCFTLLSSTFVQGHFSDLKTKQFNSRSSGKRKWKREPRRLTKQKKHSSAFIPCTFTLCNSQTQFHE